MNKSKDIADIQHFSSIKMSSNQKVPSKFDEISYHLANVKKKFFSTRLLCNINFSCWPFLFCVNGQNPFDLIKILVISDHAIHLLNISSIKKKIEFETYSNQPQTYKSIFLWEEAAVKISSSFDEN